MEFVIVLYKLKSHIKNVRIIMRKISTDYMGGFESYLNELLEYFKWKLEKRWEK